MKTKEQLNEMTKAQLNIEIAQFDTPLPASVLAKTKKEVLIKTILSLSDMEQLCGDALEKEYEEVEPLGLPEVESVVNETVIETPHGLQVVSTEDVSEPSSLEDAFDGPRMTKEDVAKAKKEKVKKVKKEKKETVDGPKVFKSIQTELKKLNVSTFDKRKPLTAGGKCSEIWGIRSDELKAFGLTYGICINQNSTRCELFSYDGKKTLKSIFDSAKSTGKSLDGGLLFPLPKGRSTRFKISSEIPNHDSVQIAKLFKSFSKLLNSEIKSLSK